MPYDAFISYASEDLAIAEQLYGHLRTAGLSIWFDKARLEPGFDWHREIEQGCENSRVLLPVLTPRWKRSEWTKYETYGAEAVVPLVFEGTWEEVRTPPLETYQAEMLDCGAAESTDWSRLLSAIRRMLAQPVPDKAARIVHMRHRANEYFTGRESELVRIHEELHRNPRTVLTQGRVRAIAGMGGAGKTTLARHYAEKFWRCYPEMYWVDCRMGIETEFARLHEVMFPDAPCLHMSDAQLAQRVLGLLNGRQTRLLILDNAEDEQSVMRWIPRTGGCHTLITSRFSGWSAAIKTLHLYVLEKGPSVAFLQRRSGVLASAEELTACGVLAERLGYLPLALEQAAAYIQQQGTGFGFSDYLRLYERASSELLAAGALGSTEYPDPVATTWKPTIAKLTPSARGILSLSSLLAPTPIYLMFLVENGDTLLEYSRKFTQEIAVGTPGDWEIWIRSALGQLRDYSLIRYEGTTYSVHPLLQTVERLNIPAGDLQECVATTFDMFTKFAPEYADRPSTWGLWNDLYPHALALHALSDHLSTEQSIALLDSLARFTFGKARFDESVEFEREAFVLAERDYGADASETNDRLLNYGESLRSCEQFSEAEELFRRSLAWEEQHNGHDHRKVANCLNYLGLLLRVKGDVSEAEKCFSEGLAICERIGLSSGRAYVKLLLNLAYIWVNSKKVEAEELSRRALAQSESEFGDDDLLTLYSLEMVSTALNNQNQHEAAEPFMARAEKLFCRLLGDEHPDSIGALVCHAIVLGNLGRWEEVVPLRLRAFRAKVKLRGETDPDSLTAAHELAKAYLNAGNYSEGEALCRKVLDQREAILGENHPDTLASVTLLLSCMGTQQESDDAIALRRRLIAEREISAQASAYTELALDMNNLSVSLKKRGRFEEAETLARKALAFDERARDPSDPKIPHRLSNLSILLIATGKIAEAQQELERAWSLKAGRHDLTSARILYLKLAAALLEGLPTETPIGRLKTLLSTDELPDHADVTRIWNIRCVLDYMRKHIPDETTQFMSVLSAALNRESPVSSLDRFPIWQRCGAIAVET